MKNTIAFFFFFLEDQNTQKDKINGSHFNRTIQSKMQMFKDGPLFRTTNITSQKQTMKEITGVSFMSVGLPAEV